MRSHLAAFVLAALVPGCSDPSGPSYNLRIVVATTGIDQDADGYATVVDQASGVVPVNGLRLLNLAPGVHEVRIEGLAPNCAPDGPASVSVTIQAGQPAEVAFNIKCRAVTGLIEVRAPSSGRDFPLPGHSFSVTDPAGATWLSSVPANGTAYVSSLAPGQYELRFLPAGNCTLNGDGVRTVPVTAGGLIRDTARVEFEVTCEATTGDVRLGVTTTGSGLDPDGYTVKLDGVLVEVTSCGDYYGFGYYCDQVPVRLPLNGSHLLERLTPGDHTIELTDITAGCAVEAPHPRTVSVSLGAVSEVALRVVCGAP